eukprot:12982684-Alexandrium_andersonii.AAC.1
MAPGTTALCNKRLRRTYAQTPDALRAESGGSAAPPRPRMFRRSPESRAGTGGMRAESGGL